jgi:hypothetical protein
LVLGATGFVLPQPCEVMGVATLCATSQSRTALFGTSAW